jgi:diacylglycerol kinase (ATP)
MALKHIALIVHGSRAGREDLRHLVSWVRDKGHLVEPMTTFESGDATAFAAEAARRGVDVVAAAGGDGTINEVVNGLDGYDVPLGIIPVGTANDFARQVGIPADADHAMDVILQRKPKRFDTATLNGRRFLNVSTGGIGAEATAETPAEAKDSLGSVAYAIAGVRKLAGLSPYSARFSGDGFEYDGKFLMFAVGLTRSTGGGAMVTPMASATDGLLDLCIVEAMSRGDFARTALRVKRGEHVGGEGVQYAQLKSVTIEGLEPMAVNVDGEMSNGQRLVYRARSRDLYVHVAHLPGEGD